MMVNFNLFGNAYVYFYRPRSSEFPQAFYTLRPDRVMHLYETGKLKGYVFVPQGMAVEDGLPLLPQDTMHVRLPNPGDPYQGLGKGMSPIKPLAMSGDVDNAATSFLKLFFDQGTMPMGMITVDVPLTDEVIAEARERWLQQYGNWQNWIEPIIMGQGAEYHKLGASFDDLDLIIMGQGAEYHKLGASFDDLDLEALDARNESRIVMPFGVKLSLIESRPDMLQATYNNLETDYKMFLANTLIPELQMFEQEWRYFLRNEDGDQFAQYDYMGIPGYFDKQQHITDVSAAYQVGAATRAQYKQAIGLRITPQDDVYLVGVMQTFIPAESEAPAPQTETGAASAEEEGEKAADLSGRSNFGTSVNEVTKFLEWMNEFYETGAASAEEEGEKALTLDDGEFVISTTTPLAQAMGMPAVITSRDLVPAVDAEDKATIAQRQALGGGILDIAARFEPGAREAAQDAFGRDEREVMAIIDEAQRRAYSESASVSWSLVLADILAYYDGPSKATWQEEMTPSLAGVSLSQGEMLSGVFDQEFVGAEFVGAVSEKQAAAMLKFTPIGFTDTKALFDFLGIKTTKQSAGDMAEWFRSYVMEFADPLSKTSKDEISGVLTTAAAEGWSVPQTESALQDMFTQWSTGDAKPAEDSYFALQRLPNWRAELIARTEMIRASNAAAWGLYRSWGVTEKEWLATMDDRTRETHAMASGQVVGIDETFNVGGEDLRYPGDPRGSPGNTISCRCTVLPRI
jgi:hypothetical protein